ncbi:DUF724 domain-containing protein 7-like isoform X1 [Actinidia eriantha]|uniref:DUF724 domain-containing protein 7-like isoform X1 n=1 Tax=Actinidia eriantha TaxID=165200 RepID=UPI0025835F69|nr:DUF724 domain-containing protein 7-like isoform X1 [Actinidia eriantha]
MMTYGRRKKKKSQMEFGAGVEVFGKGAMVEVGCEEAGLRGSRYVATIVDDKINNDGELFVEYQSLLDDDNGDGGSTLLREHVKRHLVRPLPPRLPLTAEHVLGLYDVVDAFYHDGWWTGVITRIVKGNDVSTSRRFQVTFQDPHEQIEFRISDLRLHQEWVNGNWVPSPKQDISSQLKGEVKSSKKRRGRPPKLLRQRPNAAVADEKQNGDLVAADGIVVKDCITITWAECKKLPNSPTRRKNVISSLTKMSPAKKLKLQNEKVMLAASNNLEKPSLKKGGGDTGVNVESPIQDSRDSSIVKRDEHFRADGMTREVGMAIDEVLSNVSNEQPPSMWLDGKRSLTTVNGARVFPNRTIRHCTETSERQPKIVMHTAKTSERQTKTAALNGTAEIVSDANQGLPFLKTSILWETIESMEIFHMMPQKPHFRPLYSYKESSREGLALGCMVNFSIAVKKISELQFDDPRSSIEDCLGILLDLEGHGFDVKMARDRFTRLLQIKDRQELPQDKSKEVESRIMEHIHENSKIDIEIDEIDKQIRELQEKRALAMSRKEIKDSETAFLRSELKIVKDSIKSIQIAFEELAAAPLVEAGPRMSLCGKGI